MCLIQRVTFHCSIRFLVPKWKTCCSPPVLLFSGNFQCKTAPCWLRVYFHFRSENWEAQLKNTLCDLQVFLFWKKIPPPQNGPAWLVSIIQVWICVNEPLLFIQYNSNEPKVSNPNKWTCFQNHFESSWSATWWFFKILQYCLYEIEVLLLNTRWKVKKTLNSEETAEKNIVFKK